MIGAEKNFYLFGMGDREKLIYRDGALLRYPTCETIRKYSLVSERIIPWDYTVELTTSEGTVIIREDEVGVTLTEPGMAEPLLLTSSPLHLPEYREYSHPEALRILHHEILVNIIGGQPVPNYFVYPKAWYRDGAMMVLVLEHTGNLHLLKDWAAGLTEVYDRNNGGNREPDNLGQMLFILSRLADVSHPLVEKVCAEANSRLTDGVLHGSTDGADHPLYATKWLKYGLEALGLDSSHVRIPEGVEDSYNYLFWMDYRDMGYSAPYAEQEMSAWYPYLWWARQHFYDAPAAEELFTPVYPMTWETCASQANYRAIAPLSAVYADANHAAPHTWHAAEMYLYLISRQK